MKRLIALVAALVIGTTSAAGINNAATETTTEAGNENLNSIVSFVQNFDFIGHYQMVMQKQAEIEARYQQVKANMSKVYEVDESILRGPHHPTTPSQDEGETTTPTSPTETPTDETGTQTSTTPTTPATEAPEATIPIATEPVTTTTPNSGNQNTNSGSTNHTAPTTPAVVPTEPTVAPTEPPHTHDYKEILRKDPTCTDSGHVKYQCECGSNYGTKTGALGHAWGNWYTAKEPTYDAPGTETHVCSRCGANESISIPQQVKTLSNADAEAIAELTLQYINEIRNKQGARSAVDMPGCTVYAKLRSEQMAAKGAADHSYSDSIAAATQLQYGRYIDPSIYGMPGEPYYQVYGGEAVGTGYGSTIEEVAHCLANGVSSSPAHWNYVGKDANVYMSVAVTYSKGCWYCCIITSTVDLDTNPLGY